MKQHRDVNVNESDPIKTPLIADCECPKEHHEHVLVFYLINCGHAV